MIESMLIINEKITEALEFCAFAHRDQIRKMSEIPYASHPSSVGFILLSAGYGEDVVIAGILHDVIEDTEYEASHIEEGFGKKVADLVLGVTEDKGIKDWQSRKEGYLTQVKNSTPEVKAISAADMLDNMRATVRSLRNGIDIWSAFAGRKDAMLKFYESRFEIVKDHIAPPLREELGKVLAELTSEEAQTSQTPQVEEIRV